MADLSLLDRLKTIFELVKSQSFFVTLFIIVVLTIVILTINIKIKSKAPKYIAVIVYIGLLILALIRYGNYVVSLNDSIVEKFFRAIYFPNLVVYLVVLILSILLLTVTIVDKRFSVVAKISNIFCFAFIWFFFVLILDLVKREGLDFYEVTEIYSNTTAMILLQTTMFIFLIWCGIIIIDIIARKLSEKIEPKSKKEIKTNHNEIIKKADENINQIYSKYNKNNQLKIVEEETEKL